jgi:hypothetical protein
MNACRSVCGPTGLVISARRARRRTIRAAPCRSSRCRLGPRKIGPSTPLTNGQVDRPRRPRRERDGDHLAALADDNQSPVPALDAQVLDVGVGGFGDPQPVECQQGDQCMLGGRPQPGGHQERTEFVTVQPSGVRLIIHPGTADVRGG